MSKLASKLNLSQVGRVCVTVADTDRALDFYVGTLGFEKVVDVPMGEAGRWSRSHYPERPRRSRSLRRRRTRKQAAARRASASTPPMSTPTTPR